MSVTGNETHLHFDLKLKITAFHRKLYIKKIVLKDLPQLQFYLKYRLRKLKNYFLCHIADFSLSFCLSVCTFIFLIVLLLRSDGQFFLVEEEAYLQFKPHYY